MTTIRMQVTAEADGELRLRGLPIQQGQAAEVVIITSDASETQDVSDVALIEILTHDPGWAWLKSDAEDIYAEEDIQR